MAVAADSGYEIYVASIWHGNFSDRWQGKVKIRDIRYLHVTNTYAGSSNQMQLHPVTKQPHLPLEELSSQRGGFSAIPAAATLMFSKPRASASPMGPTIVAASPRNGMSMLPTSQWGKRKSGEIFMIGRRRRTEREHVKGNSEAIHMF